jgi:hypothetical protein
MNNVFSQAQAQLRNAALQVVLAAVQGDVVDQLGLGN